MTKRHIFVLIVAFIASFGIVFVLTNNNTQAPTVEENEEVIQDESLPTDTSTPTELEDFPEIIKNGEAELSDVAGGNSRGVAVYRYDSDGNYYLEVTFADLPELEEGFFYEGWLYNGATGDAPTTGAIIESEDGLVNYFQSSIDYSDYDQYFLTLEPDDGDPAPAEHILEGTFVEYTVDTESDPILLEDI